MPCMALSIADHVHHYAVQRDLGLVVGPMRYLSDVVECEGVDGPVGVDPGPVVQLDDLLTRLVGGSPHVRARFSVSSEPQQRLTGWASEGVAEIDELPTRSVLDQTEEVGAGRDQGTADVVFGKSVELPNESFPGALKIELEVCLRIGIGHMFSLSLWTRELQRQRRPMVFSRKALLSITADNRGFPDNGQLLYPSRSNWLRVLALTLVGLAAGQPSS